MAQEVWPPRWVYRVAQSATPAVPSTFCGSVTVNFYLGSWTTANVEFTTKHKEELGIYAVKAS